MRTASLTILVMTGFLSNTAAFASAVGNAEKETAAPAVARALYAAQAAIKVQHWREAESILNHAQTPDLSGHDSYLLGEMRAYLLYQEHKPGEAAAAYAQLLHSPYGDGPVRTNSKSIAELYFQAGNYRRALEYGEAYLHRRPDDSSIAALVADSYLRLDDYAHSASTIRLAVQRAEANHQVPAESWLRIAQNAYDAMGDGHDEALVLERLVHYYNRPDDWRSLLTLLFGGSHDERLEFGYLRLRYDLGLLGNPDLYESLIFESLQAGMANQAREVLEQAEERGVFSVGRARRLQQAIMAQGLDQDRRLSQALNAARADSTGESDAVSGQIYLGEARYAQAIQAFQRSLQKGGLRNPDEIRVDLGIAALRNHQPDLAHAAFHQVSPRSDWVELANLWSLRLEHQSFGAKS